MYIVKKVLSIGIPERKEREKEEMRGDILNAAREIAGSEGIDKISIRKIAGMIEYSPAILYHYFKNKDEILEKLIEEDYAKILAVLPKISSTASPEEKLKKSAEQFIRLAMQMGDTYQSIMLNRSPEVLAKTAVLHRGAAGERKAVSMLCGVLRELPEFSGKTEDQAELTAQIIWAAAFGLSLRLTVEQVDEPQQQRLIEGVADFVLAALKNSKNPG